MSSPNETAAAPKRYDWLLFAMIVALGGSSFAMIRATVETVPPVVVTVARLWIAAILLYAVMKHAGRRLPPLFEASSGIRIHEEWRWMIAVGVIGYIGPFMIFPWAQQFIDSGLAGVYMAFMPIWTLGLAYLFAGESLDARKVIGFVLGFIGVIILIGPGVIGTAASTSILPQLALLLATLGYACAAVITRRAPHIRPRVFATGTLIAAAALSTPALLIVDLQVDAWSLLSVANVIGLGLGPTAIGSMFLIILIQRRGAGFMALSNYLTPLWAVAIGAIVFSERLELSALVALIVILCGVAVSQSGGKPASDPVIAQKMTANKKRNNP